MPRSAALLSLPRLHSSVLALTVVLAYVTLRVSAQPTPRFGHTVVTLPDGDQILYGGYAYERVDQDAKEQHFVGLKGDVWRYSVANRAWTQLNVDAEAGDGVPPARMLHTAVVQQILDAADNTTSTRLIIHGGIHFARYAGDWSHIYRSCGHDDMWAFDVDSRTWTLLQADPPGICSAASQRLASLFVLVSGIASLIIPFFSL